MLIKIILTFQDREGRFAYRLKNKINKQPSNVTEYRVGYEFAWVNSIKYQELMELEKEVNRSR